MPLPERLDGVHVLAPFGDSLTTDHISPSGEIPVDSAAGRYLASLGIAPRDFNTYVGRRGNHEVMLRGTFANLRIRNLLVPGVEGGIDAAAARRRDVMPVHEASRRYRERGTPLRGAGRTRLRPGQQPRLGRQGHGAARRARRDRGDRSSASIAPTSSSMGVIPLRFAAGEGWRALGLDGQRALHASKACATACSRRGPSACTRRAARTARRTSSVHADVQTAFERRLLQAGGMLPSVLDQLARADAA